MCEASTLRKCLFYWRSIRYSSKIYLKMHSPEEVQAQEFIDTLEFGDVLRYSGWQLVFYIVMELGPRTVY